MEIIMDRRTVLGLGAAALTAMAARAEPMRADGSLPTDPTEIVPLWPATPPGGEGLSLTAEIVERSTDTFHDRFVHKVGTPLLTVFRPERPDGSAIVLAPGGGYIRTVIDKEAFESARRFNASGVTVFVLRYRLPGEGWKQAADVPLQDAQRAMRLVRAYAAHYGIDPTRTGILGFSAGGHVAASLATRHAEKVYEPIDAADQLDARPAFAGLMYPVITMSDASHTGSRSTLLGANPSPEAVAKYSCEKQVTSATPPTWLCYALDDPAVPPVGNGLAMYEALTSAKIPAELHAFQEGGHGFGIRLAKGLPCSAWPDLFLHWGARGGWFRSGAV
jgi:acetyl esterase/lipase